ncbi:MAG: transporter substrate-binding domain-containing protein [Alphaproteobacteria bacterium]
MKLKFSICCFLSLLAAQNALAADAGLRYITTRGIVRCGTDLSSDTYAKKDEDGIWSGIDVDFCKAFSLAVFGRSDRFEMVNVSSANADKALKTNKIDIMFGGMPYSASTDLSGKASPADVLYYDRQMFLAKKIDDADSMEAYKGSKVCTVTNSEDLSRLQEYSEKYKLDFNPLLFRSENKAREAFLLNRCQLLTGNAVYLKSILTKNYAGKDDVALLPETIAVNPVYAYVAKDNITLRIISKWIINSLKLAEEKEATSQNIKVFIGTKETSTRNLLGDNPELWQKFGLKPDWVRKAIAEIGNFGEIYEKNLGKDSELAMERKENQLMKNGGLIRPQPFL